MAEFDLCFSQFVLFNEAGKPPHYEVRPDPTKDDPGAQVCAGVNSAAFPEDFAVIAALPIDQRPAAVYAFYQKTYWNQYIAQLVSNAVAAVTMDAEVNQGIGKGVRFLQEAIPAAGGSVVTVDDVWGPITLAAANSVPAASLVAAFQTVRKAAYKEIGGPDLAGWLARAAKIPPFA
jgi:hypothetical protein